jgi:SPP1 gp7 family putative phage head morphogenesis protein
VQAPPSGSPPAKTKPRRQQQKQQAPKRQPTKTAPPPAALTQAQLIAAIIAALSVAVTAAGLAAALAKVLKAWGISYLALRAVCWLVMSWPQDVLEGTGPATRWAVRTNALRRAQFLLAACRRVQQAIVAARSHGEPVRQALKDALAAEKRYMAQHIAASQQRITATTRIDSAASQYGNLLSWNAVLDPRCTPECRAADGKSFYADNPPAIGYPGTTHPNCRCFPGPPRRGAAILP